MNIKRNGDWNLISIDSNEFSKLTNGMKIETKDNYIFAEGEATNHFHAIKVKDRNNLQIVKLPNGAYVFEVKEDCVITHPEHSMKTDLEVKKGYYKLYKGREKDWFSLATRKLID